MLGALLAGLAVVNRPERIALVASPACLTGCPLWAQCVLAPPDRTAPLSIAGILSDTFGPVSLRS